MDDVQPTQAFEPSASLAALHARAALLRKLRDFFHQRDFIEVETPLVSREIIPEAHIEPIAVRGSESALPARSAGSRPRVSSWLQASPELHMKRLMAAGAEAIFQITRSFRAGELGELHNPEFTIVEWYRHGDDLQAGMELLDDLLQNVFGTPPARRTTYAQAFERLFDLCPHTAHAEAWLDLCQKHRVAIPEGIDLNDRDQWLNLLLATRVEATLGIDRPEIVYHYPSSQASLARIVRSNRDYEVAERFEVYYRAIELANGFHELGDADEQRRRFEQVNRVRMADGRPPLPLPERLLAALEHGLPDCTGCALGLDRLVMLAIGAESIRDAMAFAHERA